MTEDVQAAGKDEILKSGQVEMLMTHFPSSPYWALMRHFRLYSKVAFFMVLFGLRTVKSGRPGSVTAPIHISAKLAIKNSWNSPITHYDRYCRFTYT
jgi:hypothetical protein